MWSMLGIVCGLYPAFLSFNTATCRPIYTYYWYMSIARLMCVTNFRLWLLRLLHNLASFLDIFDPVYPSRWATLSRIPQIDLKQKVYHTTAPGVPVFMARRPFWRRLAAKLCRLEWILDIYQMRLLIPNRTKKNHGNILKIDQVTAIFVWSVSCISGCNVFPMGFLVTFDLGVLSTYGLDGHKDI